MKITSVTVRKIENENPKVKGKATIVLDDCFKITGVKVIEKDGRLFAAMPRKKGSDGMFYDTCHPTNEETRKMFDDAVSEAYNKIENE